MFTGLVQAIGTITESRPLAPGELPAWLAAAPTAPRAESPAGTHAQPIRLVIDPGSWAHRPSRGDSIAVNGCCLTVVDTARGWAFDAVPETLAKTTLGSISPGTRVNLEHAVTASTLLGGHLVQGHVDGTGEVTRISASGEYRIRFRVPPFIAQYLAPKGSITVDGVSLTIAAAPGETVAGAQPLALDEFEVALIPTTLQLTTLGSLAVGSRVNIEADTIAKTVVAFLRNSARAGWAPAAEQGR